MTTHRMNKYAEADGSLSEVGDAEFLRRKINVGDVLDFSGVRRVSGAFLDALLAGLVPETLVESFQGVEGAVSDALADWLDRASAAPGQRGAKSGERAAGQTIGTKPGKARSAPKERRSTPLLTPVFADAAEGDKYTPTRLANRLRGQLRRYIESAYPLGDATLVRSRRILLETAENGRLIAQEPFVETTPRYRAFGGTYKDLGLPEELSVFLDGLTRTPSDVDPTRTLLFPEIYEHQAEAFRAALGRDKDLVVATGTGSGKTECFLVPLLGSLHEEASRRRDRFSVRAVRALILYPMNALVNDQVARLRLLFGSDAVAEALRSKGGRHAVFGMYTSRTPYPGPRSSTKDKTIVEDLLQKYLATDEGLQEKLLKLGRWPAKDLEAFLAKHEAEQTAYQSGKKKGKAYTKHNWSTRLLTGPNDREMLTRHEMVHDPETGQGASPDILVTNYSMLEYMLMRPFERPIFEETRKWLEHEDARFMLVLDEAHMYRGARGAEVAFLLRRLLARIGIIDKPEKLRVICTSASLGGGPSARDIARRFAADLTGKAPGGFEVIFGHRDTPTPVAPGDSALAQVLANVPFDAISGEASAGALRDAVLPVLRHLGDPMPTPGDGSEGRDAVPGPHRAPEEADIPARLAGVLRGRPWLHALLAATSGQAIPLSALAARVFPESPVARKATEVLLSLGTLAREKPTDPSLIPTRIHMMFRGIAGIYACMDARCPARQARPGEEAPLGKLFAAPRAQCDCGARVLEVASCRGCGGAYLLARVPRGEVATARFLWGEAEGDFDIIQVLPTRPRNEEGVEEVLVQLETGHLLAPGTARNLLTQGGRARSLWFPRDRDTGQRSTEMVRCPLCQPPGLPTSALRRDKITDLRTRGEQPFTALVKAQFAEQPPQSADQSLPNRGRKVLVFSDGRQRAARLAPALEMSHSRDAFRQVLLLAARALLTAGVSPRVSLLFPAVLRVCFEKQINLFPAGDETQFQNALIWAQKLPLGKLLEQAAQGGLQPTLSYAKSLFAELTDRWFSLQSMGLAAVEEEPSLDFMLRDFPNVGLDAIEQKNVLRTWIRAQLERRCFLPPGGGIRDLGEPWERPEGIVLGAKHDLFPLRFAEWLQRIVGEAGTNKLHEWFRTFVERQGALRLENDAYFLQPSYLVLRPQTEAEFRRCTACSRLTLHHVRDLCADCSGDLVLASDALDLDARYGFYRDEVLRALHGDGLEPFGLTTAEHSAQLSGTSDNDAFSLIEKYELRFQDVRVENQPPIDVLSCTTTMEVGIDIGALTGVALRNVPPHVASYQQRAGRAGRRGRTIASVITYAHGGSHDAWYYDHPGEIITGEVRPPVVYIQNDKVMTRHIHAFLVQSFFHQTVPSRGKSFQLFASLGTVRSFLSHEEPCSLTRLERWIEEKKGTLLAEVLRWLPDRSHGMERDVDAAHIARRAIDDLIPRLRRELPVELNEKAEKLDEATRADLAMLLDEELLQTMIDRAILPRYAFPTDTVSFWVPARRAVGAKYHKRAFDYAPQRDLSLALSEYAPGRTLTVDKYRFESAALYSPYPPKIADVMKRPQSHTSCKACGYLKVDSRPTGLATCPVCKGSTLATLPFIRPEGFAPDVNKERGIDRGGAIRYAGMSTPAKIEVLSVSQWDEERFSGRLRLLAHPQDLVVVNKGVGDRGFLICPTCGSAEPVFGVGFTTPRLVTKDGKPKVHAHPTEEGGQCIGRALGPFYLGHQFPTDVLLMRVRWAPPMRCAVDAKRGRAGRMALTSLVEALALAAARTLQIDEGELAGNWNPVPGDMVEEADLYLYDLLPGGAGHTHQVRKYLDDVLGEAANILGGCDCASSCHKCLRHYNNQSLHSALDRGLGLALLRFVTDGIIPEVSREEAESACAPIASLLALRGTPFERGFTPSAPVPLRVFIEGCPRWVEAHHPLVDPGAFGSQALDAALGTLTPVIAIDTHTLVHDLPLAIERLEIGGGQ